MKLTTLSLLFSSAAALPLGGILGGPIIYPLGPRQAGEVQQDHPASAPNSTGRVINLNNKETLTLFKLLAVWFLGKGKACAATDKNETSHRLPFPLKCGPAHHHDGSKVPTGPGPVVLNDTVAFVTVSSSVPASASASPSVSLPASELDERQLIPPTHTSVSAWPHLPDFPVGVGPVLPSEDIFGELTSSSSSPFPTVTLPIGHGPVTHSSPGTELYHIQTAAAAAAPAITAVARQESVVVERPNPNEFSAPTATISAFDDKVIMSKILELNDPISIAAVTATATATAEPTPVPDLGVPQPKWHGAIQIPPGGVDEGSAVLTPVDDVAKIACPSLTHCGETDKTNRVPPERTWRTKIGDEKVREIWCQMMVERPRKYTVPVDGRTERGGEMLPPTYWCDRLKELPKESVRVVPFEG